ncbi:MAG: hypothetical protein CMB33_01055 [Euryarchaeota archaeon]|nr:hypothetical protein [Euryarchaeota archaeon]
MRRLSALVLIALIVMPIQASASTGSLWDDARISDESGMLSGTIGGLSIDLSNTTYAVSTSGILDMPRIVEVYTATWCSNCVKTEQALDDATADLEVTRIHYHRHLYETLDPFGSNSTDSRWVETYGAGSLLSTERSVTSSEGGVIKIPGTERSAPSNVFDGERMYTGISTKSNSLLTDYSTALALGSSHPFATNGSISLEVSASVTLPVNNQSENHTGEIVDYSFQWDISLWSEADFPWEVNSWLMFVEHNAHYPEGSNGKVNYSHVLHEAVNIGDGHEGSIAFAPPEPWDGDDMSVVMVVDWESHGGPNGENSLPAPGVATLLCMLAALVPRRQRDSELLQ